MGEEVAVGGDLEGSQAVSSHVVQPLLLASTSPQRRVTLDQLGIPYEVLAPTYVEEDPPKANAVRLVREHARGKARRSQRRRATPVLGVDTAVSLGGKIFGKPANATDRTDARALGRDPRRGLRPLPDHACLGARRARLDARHLQELTPREIAHHLTHGEWEDAPVATPSRGAARRSSRRSRDYLNVVGLPAALLVRILGERFPGAYGFGRRGPRARPSPVGQEASDYQDELGRGRDAVAGTRPLAERTFDRLGDRVGSASEPAGENPSYAPAVAAPTAALNRP